VTHSFLKTILQGDARPQLLERLSKAKNFKSALVQLRDGMRSHQVFELKKIVNELNARTVEDGFHVLNDWDGKAEKFNEDIIPVDVLNFYLTTPREGPPNTKVLGIFLDYYLIYVLALCCLRAWDENTPDDDLDAMTRLIGDLQGPNGCGHRFVANAETLMLIATSHFEPDEEAYERLLARVKTMSDRHQTEMALAHAAILGSHLRHGFQDLYERDLAKMRTDNSPDYPWLCFSIVTLMRAYVRHDNREKVVEGLLNGLTADARAFLAKSPPALAPFETDILEFRRLFTTHKKDLLTEFENHRPSDQTYSPLAFNFNFPHNLLKALVIDALLESEGVELTVNDMFTALPRDAALSKTKQALATTLTKFAKFIPDQVKGRVVPVISYDPRAGLLNFAKTMSILKENSP